MGLISRAAMIPAIIETGRIIDVDIATYTVSVVTQFSKKPQNGIGFATPYQHFVNGEGIYFMPEVGSLCWLCFPSDGNRPFVLAWKSASAEGDERTKKQDLNPGDIYLGTRDENFLILRRGGVVEIGGGPLCQRFYLPVNNTISDFAENYGLHVLGGDLEWTIARPENTTDGNRPANLSIKAKQYADDSDYIAELEIGSHETDPSTILTLIIKDTGQDESNTQISLSMSNDGDVKWDVQNTFKLTSKNNISITSTNGAVNITGKTLAEITADALQMTANGSGGALLEATSGGIILNAAQGVQVKGPGVKSMVIDGGSTPVMLVTPALYAWIVQHTHLSSSPGTPSGPPVPVLNVNASMSKSLWSD